MLSVFLKDNFFESYIVCDINKLVGFENEAKVNYIQINVREAIAIRIDDQIYVENSWNFNFAAIHREPGHEYKEYFDTNIPGAENVSQFARNSGIKNIFFTSSIAPYGRSLFERTEQSTLYPETAYGISKAMAEKIHQNWLAEDQSRRLVIVRPSVIYGPNDPGNVYRMIKSLKNGTFVLPDGGKVIKAYGYVYGLIESIKFVVNTKKDRLIIYNYAEYPLTDLKGMTTIAKNELNYKMPTLGVPTFFLVSIAGIIQVITKIIGKKSQIHPVRVKKAGFPTNIRPQYLIENNFHFIRRLRCLFV